MAIRGLNATTPNLLAGLRCLPCLLVAGLGIQAGACASATVAAGGPDAAPADATATGGSGGTGGIGGKGGSSGTGGTSTSTTGVCNPFTNSSCRSSEKCTALQQSNGTLALGCDTKGSKAEGENCSQTVTGSSQTDDDCASGLACFSIGSAAATCHRICPTSGTANACPANELCSLRVSTIDSLGFAFCRAVVTCQPLEQKGCQTGEGCYFSTSGSYTGSLCAKAGTTKPGDVCAVANDCEPGSTCLLVGAGICSSFCSTTSGGTPSCSGASTGGDTCAALGGPSDEPNLGSCRQQP
jgi:hypothetical protein